MFALLLILNCTKAPDPVALWPADPAAGLRALEATKDPLEREAAVAAILQEHPDAARQLCDLLDPGPGRARCEKLRDRPHLWTPATQKAPTRQDRTRLRLPAALAHRYDTVSPDPGACDPADAACLSADAVALVQASQTEEAAARCQAGTEARWRNECFFNAAEDSQVPPARVDEALSLCARADTFQEMCIGHVLLGLQSDDLARTPVVAQLLHDRLGDEAAPIVALFWCQAAHRLMERRPDQLIATQRLWGQEAGPHLRSAVALAVANEPDPMAAYAAVMDGGPVPALRVADDRKSARLLWHRDYPGEEAIDALPMLHNGADRRATVADPALDGRLAVLSAMGHADTPPLDAIATYLDDPDPLMRWTAARILSHLDPANPALKRAAADAVDIVRGRSKAGFAQKKSRAKEEKASPN